MQACPASPPCEARAAALPTISQTRFLAPSAMTWFSFAGAMLVAASSSAATPLYRLYQESMHLTPFWITIVFAVYVASLLAACPNLCVLSEGNTLRFLCSGGSAGNRWLLAYMRGRPLSLPGAQDL